MGVLKETDNREGGLAALSSAAPSQHLEGALSPMPFASFDEGGWRSLVVRARSPKKGHQERLGRVVQRGEGGAADRPIFIGSSSSDNKRGLLVVAGWVGWSSTKRGAPIHDGLRGVGVAAVCTRGDCRMKRGEGGGGGAAAQQGRDRGAERGRDEGENQCEARRQ